MLSLSLPLPSSRAVPVSRVCAARAGMRASAKREGRGGGLEMFGRHKWRGLGDVLGRDDVWGVRGQGV